MKVIAVLMASIPGVLWTGAAHAVTSCIAFVDVNVVATDRPVLDTHRTVAVHGERIQSISSGPPPTECRQIEGAVVT